jgi:hypothetical protein
MGVKVEMAPLPSPQSPATNGNSDMQLPTLPETVNLSVTMCGIHDLCVHCLGGLVDWDII